MIAETEKVGPVFLMTVFIVAVVLVLAYTKKPMQDFKQKADCADRLKLVEHDIEDHRSKLEELAIANNLAEDGKYISHLGLRLKQLRALEQELLRERDR